MVNLEECKLSEQELRKLITIVTQSNRFDDLINNSQPFYALTKISFHIYAHGYKTINQFGNKLIDICGDNVRPYVRSLYSLVHCAPSVE